MNNYLYLEISGNNINRFLLNCNNNNINLLIINYISYKKAIVKINKKDLNKIKKINKRYIINIKNETGIDRYKKIIYKYRLFICCFTIGLLLLIGLSNIIFDVKVIGENNILNSNIKKELETYNIQKFKFKKNYNEISIIKNKIKKKFKDNIEWIEIKENGVYYEVYIVERKVKKIINNNKVFSIVSRKNAIVKDIYTYNGISLVDVDSYVNKGDILISSDIMLNDELKDKKSAEGKVYGECWYKVRVEYPLKYKEKTYTNKTKNTFYLKIGKKYFDFFKYKNYDRKKLIFYKDKMNGFEIGIEKIRQIKHINKEYNNNEALDEAVKEAKKQMLERIKSKEKIINQKTLKFYSNGSKIIVDIFFSVYEEIGEKRIIEMGEVDDRENIN